MTEPRTPFRMGGFAAQAMRLYDEANALASQGLAEEAEVAYRRALAVNPRFAEAHNNLGNVLRALGRAAEAAARGRPALAGLDLRIDMVALAPGRFPRHLRGVISTGADRS